MPVKIKRLHPDAVIPKYATELAAGFDLVAVEDVVIAPGETKLISLGFAVEIPEGFEMQVRPRSGVTLKTKLRVGNSPGTIDADFRGEVKVIVDNISRDDWSNAARRIDNSYDESTRDKCVAGSYIIRKGDRIAQGVIAPVYRADFIIVDHLGETERGDGGFGSTGAQVI
ncbi:dUTP diphosphatase [Paenibacillus dendritiformis]|uniref:dUTP diphosphatase n=1 Tax=Paenibacillus dendritiformis TaxID=130049 RepID=UPI00387E1055